MRRTQLDTALLLLRLVAGVTMFLHGWQKLSTAGFGGVGGMFDEMGVPLASVAGPVVMVIELVGGVLLVAGLGTRVVAALIAVIMLGALFIVHLPSGFFVADGGYELVLLLAAVGGALVLTGPGSWSADALVGGRRAAARVDARPGEHPAV